MAEDSLNWESAKEHFDEYFQQYRELPNYAGTLGIILTFNPIQKRYENGERTPELFSAMMAVK